MRSSTRPPRAAARLVERPEVVGAEPPHPVGVTANTAGGQVRAAQVPEGHRGAAEQDAPVVVDAHLAAGQRLPVVDASAGGLAHAVRRQHPHPPRSAAAARADGAAAPPTSTASNGAGRPARGGRRSSRSSWVGTRRCSGAGPGVEPRGGRGERLDREAGAGVQARGLVPATTDRTSTCSPATWWAGMASSHWPGPPSRSWVARPMRAAPRAVSSARLGVPVEPEVPTTTATPSGRSAGSSSGRSAVWERGVRDHRGPSPASAAARRGGTCRRRPPAAPAAAAAGGGPPAEDRSRRRPAILAG